MVNSWGRDPFTLPLYVSPDISDKIVVFSLLKPLTFIVSRRAGEWGLARSTLFNIDRYSYKYEKPRKDSNSCYWESRER